METAWKKILNIVLRVVTWILIAFTAFMMIFTVFTVTTVDKNDRSIFGVKFYIVLSDSMSKSEKNEHMDVHFNAGDMILIANVDDPTTLQEGDIIAFISTNEDDSFGKTITHMIREVKKNDEGKVLGYVTYGINNDKDDDALVEPGYVLGKYTGVLPGVGHFFNFVKSTPGYIVCILIPFLLLILYNGVNVIRLFRKYKKEQMEAMQAEREKIEEERAETQRMMAELMALKAQLVNTQNGEEKTSVYEPEKTSPTEKTPDKVSSSEVPSEVSPEASSEATPFDQSPDSHL